MKGSRILGGILLVSGTTIGAGMLALPVVTGLAGFFPSLAIFAICWLVMLFTAFCLLDVTLSMKKEANLISMSRQTLGPLGAGAAWLFYLLLLYSLLAAYITGSAQILTSFSSHLFGVTPPAWLSPFLLPSLFGLFVYGGTRGVDRINRLLAFALFLSYALLISLAPASITPSLLMRVDGSAFLLAFPIIITSFGYHIIIPTLVTYVGRNRTACRRILLIGSLLPLLLYTLWQVVVLGIVPPADLFAALRAGAQAIAPLTRHLQSGLLTTIAGIFAFFAIVTSFLGVSLSLSDFLTDGFSLKRTHTGQLAALALVFLPPLLFIFATNGGFIVALEYAAAFVALLLILLPVGMAWRLSHPFYRSLRGRALLGAVALFALGIVAIDIAIHIGLLRYNA